MKLDVQTNNTTSNLTGMTGECEFDPDGLPYLRPLLSKIYGNSKLAVLREYAANGRDSNVAAGYSGPVEVFLPTPANPNLTIIDHGIGLSLHECISLFATYMASSKRGENVSVGGFGLGSKSAFTIADQFTVEAIKDNRLTVVAFHMENLVPRWTIVHEATTDKGNGVTVKIPVDESDYRAWVETASKCFTAWPLGSILVDGLEPETIYAHAEKVTDSMWISRQPMKNSIVVMGGLAYDVDYELTRQVRRTHALLGDSLYSNRLIIEVPIGSVDIRPDREGLRDTHRTIDAIIAVVEEGRNRIDADFDANYNNLTDPMEQAKVIREFNVLYRNISQRKFPSHISTITVDAPMVVNTRNSSRPVWMTGFSVNPANTEDTEYTYITGVGTKKHKVQRFLKRWRDANESPEVVLVESDTLSVEWWTLNPSIHTIITVDDFLAAAQALPAPERSGGTVDRTVSYWCESLNTSLTLAEVKELDMPVLLSNHCASNLRDIAPEMMENHVVLSLRGRQTEDALIKRVGDLYAGTTSTLFQKEAARLHEGMTPEDTRMGCLYKYSLVLATQLRDKAKKNSVLAGICQEIIDANHSVRARQLYRIMPYHSSSTFHLDDRIEWLLNHSTSAPESVQKIIIESIG